MKFNFYSYLLIQKKPLIVSVTNANTVITEIDKNQRKSMAGQHKIYHFKCMKFKR